MRRVIFSALVWVLTSGCSGGVDGPKEPTATGAWTGTTATSTFSLTLSELNGNVSGSGFLAAGSTSLSVVASGTRANRNVSLTISVAGYQNMNYQATFSAQTDDVLLGRLNGSGFINQSLDLHRN